MPVLVILGLVAAFVLMTRKSSGGPQSSLEASIFPGSGQTAIVPLQQPGQPQLTQYQQRQVQQFQQLSVIASSGAVAGAAALGLTAVAATGVGAVVAAAVIAFGVLRGTAHLVANEWTDPVSGVQAKFNKALAAIVDAKDASLGDRSATKTSVSYAKLSVEALYRAYKVAAEQFALQDRDHRTVINNSYRTLDPIVAQITGDMARQIAALPY